MTLHSFIHIFLDHPDSPHSHTHTPAHPRLPDELLEHILSMLDPVVLLVCACVCRRLHTLASQKCVGGERE